MSTICLDISGHVWTIWGHVWRYVSTCLNMPLNVQNMSWHVWSKSWNVWNVRNMHWHVGTCLIFLGINFSDLWPCFWILKFFIGNKCNSLIFSFPYLLINGHKRWGFRPTGCVRFKVSLFDIRFLWIKMTQMYCIWWSFTKRIFRGQTI